MQPKYPVSGGEREKRSVRETASCCFRKAMDFGGLAEVWGWGDGAVGEDRGGAGGDPIGSECEECCSDFPEERNEKPGWLILQPGWNGDDGSGRFRGSAAGDQDEPVSGESNICLHLAVFFCTIREKETVSRWLSVSGSTEQ